MRPVVALFLQHLRALLCLSRCRSQFRVVSGSSEVSDPGCRQMVSFQHPPSAWVTKQRRRAQLFPLQAKPHQLAPTMNSGCSRLTWTRPTFSRGKPGGQGRWWRCGAARGAGGESSPPHPAEQWEPPTYKRHFLGFPGLWRELCGEWSWCSPFPSAALPASAVPRTLGWPLLRVRLVEDTAGVRSNARIPNTSGLAWGEGRTPCTDPASARAAAAGPRGWRGDFNRRGVAGATGVRAGDGSVGSSRSLPPAAESELLGTDRQERSWEGRRGGAGSPLWAGGRGLAVLERHIQAVDPSGGCMGETSERDCCSATIWDPAGTAWLWACTRWQRSISAFHVLE